MKNFHFIFTSVLLSILTYFIVKYLIIELTILQYILLEVLFIFMTITTEQIKNVTKK